MSYSSHKAPIRSLFLVGMSWETSGRAPTYKLPACQGFRVLGFQGSVLRGLGSRAAPAVELAADQLVHRTQICFSIAAISCTSTLPQEDIGN